MRNINLNNLKLICFIIFPSAAIIGCKDFNKQESQSAPYPSEIFNKTEIQKFNKELEVSIKKAAHEAVIKMEKNAARRDEGESSSNNTYTVATSQAFFHNEATNESRRNAYLVFGDAVISIQESNDFIYVTFLNSSGRESKGWIKTTDLTNY
jgi:hypothetical protein